MKKEIEYLKRKRSNLIGQLAVLEDNSGNYTTKNELILYNKKVKDYSDELEIIENIMDKMLKEEPVYEIVKEHSIKISKEHFLRLTN